MMTNFKDERIEQGKNKIYSELMLIIFYIVVLSFMIKSLYFQMDLKQCATEYIILIFAPLYQAFRSRQLGVVLNETGGKHWKTQLPVALAIIFMVILLWLNNEGTPAEARTLSAVFSLLVFAILFLVLQFVFLRVEKRRAKKLEHEFDDED